MLTPYRRVLSLPGTLAFSAAGLVARLPISMVSLGIVLLVSAGTGSYTVAGTVAGAYLLGNAGFAVLQGRMADRLGQSRVLPWTILVFTLSLSLMAWSVQAAWPAPLPHLLATVGGAALPQIGSCVRARWSHNVADKDDLRTAFALEAVVDEAVFMVGPVVVTLLATALHPVAGLATAVLAGLAGTLALAAQRGTEPPMHRHTTGRRPRQRLPWAVLGPLAVSGAMLGLLFGGSEVAAVAFAEELGAKAAAGVVLAVFALGSLVAGLVAGSVRWRSSNASRYRWFMSALAVAVLPLPFVESLILLGMVLFVAGFGVSPTLIAAVAWIEESVPPRRLTEGISVTMTGMYVGIAPGAALVGAVVDRHGASASFWVPVVATWVGAAVALGTLLVPGRPATASAG